MFKRWRKKKTEQRSYLGEVLPYLSPQSGFNTILTGRQAEAAHSAVVMAIDLISQAVASCPIKVISKQNGSDLTRGHDLESTLYCPEEKFGEKISYQEWMRVFIRSYLLFGNAVAYLEDGGRNWKFIPWQNCTLRVNKRVMVYTLQEPAFGGEVQTRQIIATPDQVLHLRNVSDDAFATGLSNLQRSATTTSLANSLSEAVTSFWKNACLPASQWKMDTPLTDAQRREFRAELNNLIGSHNMAKPLLMPPDQTFEYIKGAPTQQENDTVKLKQAIVDDIARVFSLDSRSLSQSMSTGYNSFAMASKEKVASMSGLIKHLEQMLTIKLLDMTSECFEIEQDSLVDIETRFEKVILPAAKEGILSGEDVRRMMGWNDSTGNDKQQEGSDAKPLQG